MGHSSRYSSEQRRLANARSTAGAAAANRYKKTKPEVDLKAAADRLFAWMDEQEADNDGPD